ncbi:arsenic resistance N-acetyltransferase ArsN2 [Mucilaginibacter paludis]|uniref:GCN5-related N-acetyltransferase n=1 Tax=Mucilaginibacter paludis DSM 18603 TaxID=714943 RepID=H1YEY2_9SPHI|nr:arsenic resistance N-acetyltransferase ArsN2 [Mucilaginibacter paludis]EHQ24399.1 GCN5-related N-acetyltransferase [Mucilaginibacter paludis DSM 18603]
MLIENATPYRASVINLLKAEKLPFEDLPDSLENFLVTIINHEITGIVGLECYGNVGLLRSMMVAPRFRGRGIAHTLIQHAENLGRNNKLKAIYLLTETASGYFSRKGYQQIARDIVPDEIKQSSEYDGVCPQTAIVMGKSL